MEATLAERAALAMSRARISLVMEHPFFGSLALRLRFKQDKDCRDLWSDGRQLGYNPTWVVNQTEGCLVAAQAHELLHLACEHHLRRKGRDAVLWNRACDYAVNLLLEESGFTLPEGFLLDRAYHDQSVDAIYASLSRLPDQPPNYGVQTANQEEESTIRADGMSGGNEGPSGQGNSGSNTASNGQRDEKAANGRGTARNTERQREISGKATFVGEVRDHPLLSSREESQALQDAEREAQISLVLAMHRALHAGDMPGRFARLLRHVVRPKLDWRELLQRFLESRVDNDSSWSSPNRRYLHQDLYLPSRREPVLPRVVLAVDSSGSVDEVRLAAFCAELSAILQDYDTTLTVLFHDTEVRSQQSFGRQDLPFTLTPHGGGGTDFRPVPDYVEQENLQPVCLLWFTDLECSRFPDEPDYPVLWITSGREDNSPPFGEWLPMPAIP